MSISNSDSDDIIVKYKSKSFGKTLWQPEFLDDDYVCGREYKSEWRRYLARKNLEQISTSLRLDKNPLRFTFYTKIIVGKVFDICRVLRQPPEVRYLALEILDRFMINHFFNVALIVIENGNWTPKVWKIITTRIVNQSFLRLISAIQLASKYCSNFRAVSTSELQAVLTSSGQQYFSSKTDLVKSEIRVYQTIKYSIPNVTPLTYIEMFIEDFRKGELELLFSLTLSSFFNICVDVLDVALIFHKEIYLNLCVKITGKAFMSYDNTYFSSVKADYMYLAASVVHAAAALQDPARVVPEALSTFFSSVTPYKSGEIEKLGNIIVEIILDK